MEIDEKFLREIGIGVASDRRIEPYSTSPYDTGLSQPDYYNPRDPQLPAPLPNMKRNYQLKPWQQAVVNEILGGRDILVTASPSSGKTLPLIRAWETLLAQARNTANMPRILWVCPTRQLANQIYHDDIRESILDSLQAEGGFPNFLLPGYMRNMLSPGIPGYISGTDRMVRPDQINDLRRLFEEWVVLGAGEGGYTPPSRDTFAFICTYSFAPQYIEAMTKISGPPKFVVIDELQEYVPVYEPQEAGGKKDLLNKSEEFVKIFRGLPLSPQTVVVMLTGSMNSQTSGAICEFMNSSFKRNMTVFPPIGSNLTPGGNPSNISIVPTPKMRTADHVVDAMADMVYKKDMGNLVILFSVKNTSDQYAAKKAIMPIARRVMQRTARRTIETVTGVNLAQLRQHGNMTRAQVAALMAKDDVHPAVIANDLEYMLSFAGSPLNVRDRRDPELAEAILHGIGWIAGGITYRGFQMHNDDIRIVQHLYSKGMIYCVLATNMVGIGANLNVQKLYVPSLQIFSDGGMKALDDSQLVQLLHRVGRRSGLAVTIYCDPNDFGRITSFIQGNDISIVPYGTKYLNNALFKRNIIDDVTSLFGLLK